MMGQELKPHKGRRVLRVLVAYARRPTRGPFGPRRRPLRDAGAPAGRCFGVASSMTARARPGHIHVVGPYTLSKTHALHHSLVRHAPYATRIAHEDGRPALSSLAGAPTGRRRHVRTNPSWSGGLQTVARPGLDGTPLSVGVIAGPRSAPNIAAANRPPNARRAMMNWALDGRRGASRARPRRRSTKAIRARRRRLTTSRGGRARKTIGDGGSSPALRTR